MSLGEAYLDIVWKQFKKNWAARIALWLMAPLFLLAIFAPAIASNTPFVFYEGDSRIYPWLWELFNPSQTVDFIFNMALLGFVPWLLVAIATNWRMKRGGAPGRRRIGVVTLEFLAMLLLLCVAFSIPGARPANPYRDRSFAQDELKSSYARHGLYAPIPFGPTEIDLDSNFQPPFYRKLADKWHESNDGVVHILGTDDTGRDVLARMIYGTRISMTVGFVAVGLYMAIGLPLGALAGYFGGAWDLVISRVIEVILLFPSFFLILTLVAFSAPSIYIVMVVIGVTGWPTIARLTRGEVLKQRSIDYTVAARALGASNMRIVFRHILPNALSPALVAAPFGVASAIVTEASLSLLGVGAPPPTPTWGSVLHLGHDNYHHWWLIVVPSAAIFITVTVFNLVGSGLRDAMDPKLRI